MASCIGYRSGCPCRKCMRRAIREVFGSPAPQDSNRGSNWSEPMGGSDADGNSITASFGSGRAEGHTLLGDGDRSEIDFLNSANHDHYGPGNGPNDNGTSRGQYTGLGY